MAREARGQDAIGGYYQVRQHGLGDKLFVNGQGQGLSYFDVVEGGHLGIETEVADAVVGGSDLKVPVDLLRRVEDPVYVSQADAREVDLVVFVHGHADAAAEKEVDGVQVGWLFVVEVVPFEPDALADLPLSETEGAGAVGPGGPIGARLDVLLVDDEGGGVGKLGEEIGLGGVDGYFEGIVVQDANAADAVGRALELGGGAYDVVQVEVGDGGFGTGVQGPLHGEFEVVGCHGLAVVELDVVSQVEGEGPLVVAEVPPGGDVGDDVEVGVDGNEAAEDLDDYECGTGVGGEGGVQGGGVGEESCKLTTRTYRRVRDRCGGGKRGPGRWGRVWRWAGGWGRLRCSSRRRRRPGGRSWQVRGLREVTIGQSFFS